MPSEVMKEIGADLCNLPEIDGFKHLIVCIYCFSKWLEAKAIKGKPAPTDVSFLYDIIGRNGCINIQINHHGIK